MEDIKALVSDYAQVMAQLEALDLQRIELRAKVLNKLGELGLSRYEDDDYSALIAEKETFKYTNETGMVEWLKNNGYEKFVNEKVDVALNKELKSNVVELNEGLKGMFVKNYSNQLIVKPVEK